MHLLALLPLLASSPAPLAPQTLDQIDHYFQDQVLRAGFPGATLVVTQGDSILLARAAGLADVRARVPATLDTPFCIGSLTKSFTATALLQLRDEGRVELDAPVTRYLPWFRVADEGAAEHITLRHLLTHVSGLPTNSHAVVWQDESSIRGSVDRAVRALRAVHLRRPPGTAFEYANMNYVVLGRVIEEVAGMPWDRYLAERVFRPLGMNHTSTRSDAAEVRGLARPYAPEFGLLIEEPAQVGDFLAPATNIVSTAPDLARFAMAQLGFGPRLLSPATLEEAHTGGAEKTPGVHYGLGWMNERLDGVAVVHHSGTTGHASALYLVPERELAVVVLFGAYSHSAKEEIARGIVSIALGGAPPKSLPRELPELLWMERGLLAATLVLPATAGLFPVLRRRTAVRPPRKRAAKAAALVVAAAASWLTVLLALPKWIPEHPVPFGLHGWVPQLAVTCGAVLLTTTAWAVWGVVATLRPARRPS